MADASLSRRSPFAGLLRPVPGGTGREGDLVVAERCGREIATVIARGGTRDAVSARVRAACGIDLPAGPRRTVARDTTALGVGPRTWLVMQDAGQDLVGRLTRELGSAAAVTDQSDAYGVLRISGGAARAVLRKGMGIDLHPRAFDPTSVAVSTCSHIGTIIWQTDDRPTYEVALFRSYAESFAHWLHESAAEFDDATKA